MDKIKAFFQSKITKTVFWIMWILSTIGLVICGATGEALNSAVALVLGIVQAVLLLLAFVYKQLKD